MTQLIHLTVLNICWNQIESLAMAQQSAQYFSSDLFFGIETIEEFYQNKQETHFLCLLIRSIELRE